MLDYSEKLGYIFYRFNAFLFQCDKCKMFKIHEARRFKYYKDNIKPTNFSCLINMPRTYDEITENDYYLKVVQPNLIYINNGFFIHA